MAQDFGADPALVNQARSGLGRSGFGQGERLLALAERCEAATGPDRELDAEIYMAAHPKIRLPRSRPLKLKRVWPTVNGGRDVFWYETKNGCMGGINDQPYTASIDAAMTLVPEGVAWACGFGVDHDVENEHGWAWCGTTDEPNQGAYHWTASVPLALCAAALRARAAIAQRGTP